MNEHDDMNQHHLEARLRSAIHTEADEADPGALHERVRSIPDTVEPQPQRWWHGLSSGASRGAGLDGARVKGGTTMFSAVRVAAVVAALALGTTFAINTISEPTGGPTPGAVADAEWLGVTGSGRFQIDTRNGGVFGRQAMSDDRVSGDVYTTWEAESGANEEGDWTMWGATRITNEQGTWEGEYAGFIEPDGQRNAMGWFEGSGAYEGLSYLQHMHGYLGDVTLTGLVYPGSIPPTVVRGMDGPLKPAPPLPEG
jgi:hypothetical protein